VRKDTTPTLRDLALDRIHQLAEQIRKQDLKVTREQAIAKAVATPAGREAYSLYRAPGSHLPWPDAISLLREL
jgi:propanediol dehydratase small subunit